MTRPHNSARSSTPARRNAPLALVAAVPLALGLWAGTTAFASSAAQGAAGDLTAQLEQTFRSTDLLTVKESSFEKGFLQSTHRMVVQPVGAEDDPKAGWEVINHIQHGPLAGGALARAVVDTEIRFLDPEVQAKFDQAVGGQKPRIHTVIGLGGEAVTDLELPAGTVNNQGESGSEQASEVKWQPLTGQLHTSAQGRLTGYNLTWPGLQATAVDDPSSNFSLENLSFVGKQNFQSAQDLIGTGEATFTVSRLAVGGSEESAVQMMNINVTSATTLPDPEHYDSQVSYSVGTLQLPEQTSIGGLNMQIGLRHLAREPMQQLAKVYEDVRREAQAGSDGSVEFTPEQEQQMEEATSQSVHALLAAEPVISLDKLGFDSPGKGMNISGQMAVKGLAEALGTDEKTMPDWEETMQLLPAHTQANLEVRTSPETMDALGQLGGATGLSAADLVSSGTFREEGGNLVSTLSYENGAISINGEPMGAF